jgi:hypothetical protein
VDSFLKNLSLHALRQIQTRMHPATRRTRKPETSSIGCFQPFGNTDKSFLFSFHFSEFLRHEFAENGESNVQRLRQGFRRLDLDGDGLITKTEVINLAERVYEESYSR